jgi:two-component system sensor histidine kinase BarA
LTAEGKRRGNALPFSTYLVLCLILITVPVIGFISMLDYVQVEKELITNNKVLQDQTETSIILSMNLVDTGLKLFDDTLNRQMQEGFDIFLDEYERAGRDPAAMNLTFVQEQLGGTMDLYIINESGVIEYTTYPPDLGLDFKTNPAFYEAITDIRLGDAFAADRIMTDLAGGQLRKYAYLPTPDHRYLLELGFNCTALQESQCNPQYQILGERLMDLNPMVEEIRVYDSFGRDAEGTASASLNEPSAPNPVAVQVFQLKGVMEQANATAGKSIRYIFVDLSDPAYASDVSRVIEITYNTTQLDSQLKNTLASHIILAVVASLLTCCVAPPISRTITRPIREIVGDVNRIAGGDLDHRIRVSAGTEFTRLEQSINAMVATMKVNIRRLQQSEKTARQYSENLEELVQSRTAELQATNQMANLYLDIMIHDINNANMIAIGYTQILADSFDGERQEYARKMLNRLQMSSEIIGHVATIRKLQNEEPIAFPVDLDRIIRAQMANFPTGRIRYEGTPATVCADKLFSDILVNLLGNAIQFGGPDVEVTIRVNADEEDEVMVSVEDTGPGIPDAMKEQAFNRLRKGEGATSGTGLGLYICRMLVERYGGRIWADDRVPGRPELGAAIRFTLKRAKGRGADRQET